MLRVSSWFVGVLGFFGRGRSWLLLLCLVSPLSAVASPGLGDALAYVDDGDYPAAVLTLKRLLQKDSKDAEARLMLGRVYVLAHQGEAAEKELRWARRLGVDSAELDWLRGLAFLLQNRSDDVLTEFRERSGMDIERRLVFAVLRGRALLSQGDTNAAKAEFEKALALRDDSALARLGLAQLLLLDGRLDEAAQALVQATNDEPDCVDCWVALGEVQRKRGDGGLAAQAFEKALDLVPKEPMASIGLASLAIDDNDLAAAREYLAASRQLLPYHPLRAYLEAVLAFRDGDLETAQEKVEQALEGLPRHPPSLLLAGSIAFVQGHFASAITQLEHYAKAVEVMSPVARKMLAKSEIELRLPDKAIAWLQPLVDRRSQDPELSDLLARAYQLQGDYARASRYLERLKALAPDDQRVQARLALMRMMAGEQDGGLSELEALASDSGSYAGPELLLAVSALKARRYDKALAAAQALADKPPMRAMAFNLMGLARLGLEDEKRARLAFVKALEIEPGNVAPALNLARLDLRQGEREQARDRVSAVLRLHPKDVRAMLLMAQLSDGFEQQRSWIEKAMELAPDSVDAGKAMVALQLQRGDKDAALVAARSLEEKRPDDPRVIELLANTQMGAGKTDSAVVGYRKLLEKRPRSVAVRLKLASALLRSGNAREAGVLGREILGLGDVGLAARLQAIRLVAAAGDFDGALAQARKLQSEQPTLADGFRLEGDIYLRSGDRDRALQRFSQAFKLQPDGVLARRIADLEAASQRLDVAQRVLSDWLVDHGDDDNARVALANYFQLSGQEDKAAREYEAVLLRHGDYVPGLNNLALLYLKQASPKALDLARRAYGLAPSQPAIADTFGSVLMEFGQTSKAIEVLQRAADQDQAPPVLRLHLAQAYAKAGQDAKARSVLERLLVRNSHFEQADEARSLLNRLGH